MEHRQGSGAGFGPLPRRPAAPLIWHLWLDETPRPGWANMAIDHSLLDRAEQLGESWLRLYQWAPHCLSFGRHEPALRRYHREGIMALGLDTVRRPTGGRAVWHAQELTYAVAAPSAHFGKLGRAYLEIHRMLADALYEVGAPAYLAPAVRTPAIDAGPCFAQPVGGEIMIAGRKVVGSAQLRQGGALLQHGSILLQDNQELMVQLMRGEAAPSPTSALAEPWALASDIAQAIAAGAARCWPAAWRRIHHDSAVLPKAAKHYMHYRSAAWTWAR